MLSHDLFDLAVGFRRLALKPAQVVQPEAWEQYAQFMETFGRYALHLEDQPVPARLRAVTVDNVVHLPRRWAGPLPGPGDAA